MRTVIQFGILFIVETLLIYSLLASVLETTQMLLLSLVLAGMATLLGFLFKTPLPSTFTTKTIATETVRLPPPLPDSMYRRKPAKPDSPLPPVPPTPPASTTLDFSDCF
jgi:hypothetical protein